MKEQKKDKLAVALAVFAAVALAFLFGRLSAHREHQKAATAALCASMDSLESDTLYEECIEIEEYERELERIAWAIAMVESNGNPAAVNGRCVGVLQITPVMVKEANRLLGEDLYYMSDRETVSGSIAIFGTVMAVYNPTLDVRKACRIWNPNGGEEYYQRVMSWYERGGER